MAKIEMDISEYEEIKKNQKLLEESLQREKELSLAIELLQKEKIEVMEQNKKSVTIIEKVEKTEIIYSKVSTRDFEIAINNLYRAVRGPRDSSTHIDSLQDYAIDKLFTRTESTTCPPHQKQVIYKGLDEVEDRIRKELQESVDLDVKNKLKSYEKLSATYEKVKKDLILLKSEVNTLQKANESLNKEVDSLSIENEDLNILLESEQNKVETISDLINNIEKKVLETNIFNKKRKNKEIFNLIEEWQK